MQDLTPNTPDASPTQTGVHRVEYSVTTVASPQLSWDIYIDWENWRKFHPSYGNMQWIKGEPWQRGSCLAIEITQPVRFTVEHRITSFVPGDRIAWIDHSGFITIEQWVYFRAIDGGTQIETWADLVGPPTIKGVLALPLFKQFTKHWYNKFAEYCDGLAQR